MDEESDMADEAETDSSDEMMGNGGSGGGIISAGAKSGPDVDKMCAKYRKRGKKLPKACKKNKKRKK